MKVIFGGDRANCEAIAKSYLVKGETVTVTYNDYFCEYQVNLYEPDET